MKLPLEWLKAYVPVRLSPEALAERLTMAGLEVTGLEGTGAATVFHLEITPNRADCLSIIGIAREVAAATGQRLTLDARSAARGTPSPARIGPAQSPSARESATSKAAKPVIRIEDRTGCPRYVGRLLEGVRVGPSPEWLQRRLLACGLRPINNVVDVTNYVLLECGQPLHAFDTARLAGGTILVRRAKPQEPLTTLDGMRRALPASTLVIADAQRPVAIAGIMGGADSGVTAATTTVLLESALFDPITVRRTARALGLASESSYRFERGVDPAGVETASARAAALLGELAGARQTAVVDVGTKPAKRTAIVLEVERAGRWLGMPLAAPAVRTTLARLACRVASAGAGMTLQVTPPTFRRDLTQAVDLYEELARMAGYDRLPARRPTVPMPSEAAPMHEPTYALRQLCAGLGLTEVMTWSLIAPSLLERLGYSGSARLANPLSQDHAAVRPSLVPGLLQAVRHNMTQGADGVRLFELGRVVSGGVEQLRLGVALSGVWVRDWRASDPGDFFRLLGLVQALAHRLGLGIPGVVSASLPWAQTGGELVADGQRLGTIGTVSPAVLSALDLEQGVWLAELSADALIGRHRSPAAVRAPSPFPPVRRDLSVLVDAATPFDAIDRIVREAAGALASRIELIDRYAGGKLPPGKVGLTVSLEYRDAQRTLTAAEADAVHQRVTQALADRVGASRR